MVWITADLAAYLLHTTTVELTAPIRSDHIMIVARFDIHTLVDAMPPEVLNAHYVRAAYLNTIDLDALWDTSQSTVMTAAYAHIPCLKTGGRPQPHDEERLRAKTGDLGRIIRMMRTVFVAQSDDNLRLRARDRLRQWYAANGDDLDLAPLPTLTVTPDKWDIWRCDLQRKRRTSRLLHRQYLDDHKQQLIQERILRRNANFMTNTRQTIQSLPETTSGRVVLDHLIVEDDTNGLYVKGDTIDIKQRVRQYFYETFHAERARQPLEGR
ncbi:unnamed protein product [Mortierella alpina]